MDVDLQTSNNERLHVISTHAKFEDVSTDTSNFGVYNVRLLSENFELHYYKKSTINLYNWQWTFLVDLTEV